MLIRDYIGFRVGFGERVRKARKAKGLSLSAVGRAMNTTKNVICNYEHGDQLPRTDKLFELCEVLEVSADWLMGRVDNG